MWLGHKASTAVLMYCGTQSIARKRHKRQDKKKKVPGQFAILVLLYICGPYGRRQKSNLRKSHGIFHRVFRKFHKQRSEVCRSNRSPLSSSLRFPFFFFTFSIPTFYLYFLVPTSCLIQPLRQAVSDKSCCICLDRQLIRHTALEAQAMSMDKR